MHECKENVCVCVCARKRADRHAEFLCVFTILPILYTEYTCVCVCVCTGMWLGVFYHILEKSSLVPLILSSSKHRIGQRYVAKGRETT